VNIAGADAIPERWRAKLAHRDILEDFVERLLPEERHESVRLLGVAAF